MKVTNDPSRSGLAAVSALGVSLIVSLASVASAAPIVDGRLDPDEGYTDGRYVSFAVERVDTIVEGGQLWLHEDGSTGDVTVFFSQPLTLVDNTYGENAVGWGKGVAPSGKNHNFSDLVGSDKARFTFTDGAGQTVLDVTMDYISEAAGGAYRSLGVTGADGAVNVGSGDLVLDWGTSLDYNFNSLGHVLTQDSPATDEDYTENALFPGWIFEVTYELRVSGAAFGDNGFGGVTVPIVHDSPNKIGKNKVYPEGGDPIPEPATMFLVCGAAGALLLKRRRQS